MATPVNLAELIEPHQYKLENVTYGANVVKQMTMYDVEHISDCKDLLELIIRAAFHNYKTRVLVRDEQYDWGKIEKYEKLVAHLMAHVKHVTHVPPNKSLNIMQQTKATGRYADFMSYMIEPETPHSYFTTKNPSDDCYYIMSKCGDKTGQMSKINAWQADYFAIFNTIMKMGKNADMFGGNEWVIDRYVKWQNGTNDEYDDMIMPPWVSWMSDTESKPVQDISDHKNHTAKIICDAPIVPLTSNIETYKILFDKNYDGVEFDSAEKKAKLVAARDTYIAVKIGPNDLVFNAGRKYLIEQSQTDLSKYCICDVEYITTQNIDGPFAYPGFIFEGVTYQIDGLKYHNMYHYIKFGGNDLSMLPSEAIKLADEVEKKVECLPEIAFSKCDDTVCKPEFIKITHGMNVITTYISCQPCSDQRGEPIGGVYTESRKNDYVKSDTIIGNFEGKPHLFLRIGRQTYKITEIDKFSAANILFAQNKI